MERYFLFEKRDDGSLHGGKTVISIQDNEESMIIISPVELHPNKFREIVLRDKDFNKFLVVFEEMIDVPGVSHPGVAIPYVCQVKRV